MDGWRMVDGHDDVRYVEVEKEEDLFVEEYMQRGLLALVKRSGVEYVCTGEMWYPTNGVGETTETDVDDLAAWAAGYLIGLGTWV